MGSVFVVVVAWLLVGTVLALLIGWSVRLADRRARQQAQDAPNFVVDRPPLAVAPEFRPAVQPVERTPPPVDADPPGSAHVPATPPDRDRGAPTIPGLPVARPPVGRPAVPRSSRQHPRKTGHG